MNSAPIVGILTNNRDFEDGFHLAVVSRHVLDAVKHGAGATPILLPAYNNVMSAEDAMDICDGFLLPGARANVHPTHYGQKPDPEYGPFNHDRDALAMPLIRLAIAAGKPVLAICRGCQELAVAFGSTLYPDVEKLDGVGDHRMSVAAATFAEKIADRHCLTVRESGVLFQIIGSRIANVNSLHRQAIASTGPNVVAEAWAEDGVVEAISISNAPGFVIGVQWHPEYKYSSDLISISLFHSFGQALQDQRVRNASRTIRL